MFCHITITIKKNENSNKFTLKSIVINFPYMEMSQITANKITFTCEENIKLQLQPAIDQINLTFSKNEFFSTIENISNKTKQLSSEIAKIILDKIGKDQIDVSAYLSTDELKKLEEEEKKIKQQDKIEKLDTKSEQTPQKLFLDIIEKADNSEKKILAQKNEVKEQANTNKNKSEQKNNKNETAIKTDTSSKIDAMYSLSKQQIYTSFCDYLEIPIDNTATNDEVRYNNYVEKLKSKNETSNTNPQPSNTPQQQPTEKKKEEDTKKIERFNLNLKGQLEKLNSLLENIKKKIDSIENQEIVNSVVKKIYDHFDPDCTYENKLILINNELENLEKIEYLINTEIKSGKLIEQNKTRLFEKIKNNLDKKKIISLFHFNRNNSVIILFHVVYFIINQQLLDISDDSLNDLQNVVSNILSQKDRVNLPEHITSHIQNYLLNNSHQQNSITQQIQIQKSKYNLNQPPQLVPESGPRSGPGPGSIPKSTNIIQPQIIEKNTAPAVSVIEPQESKNLLFEKIVSLLKNAIPNTEYPSFPNFCKLNPLLSDQNLENKLENVKSRMIETSKFIEQYNEKNTANKLHCDTKKALYNIAVYFDFIANITELLQQLFHPLANGKFKKEINQFEITEYIENLAKIERILINKHDPEQNINMICNHYLFFINSENEENTQKLNDSLNKKDTSSFFALLNTIVSKKTKIFEAINVLYETNDEKIKLINSISNKNAALHIIQKIQGNDSIQSLSKDKQEKIKTKLEDLQKIENLFIEIADGSALLTQQEPCWNVRTKNKLLEIIEKIIMNSTSNDVIVIDPLIIKLIISQEIIDISKQQLLSLHKKSELLGESKETCIQDIIANSKNIFLNTEKSKKNKIEALEKKLEKAIKLEKEPNQKKYVSILLNPKSQNPRGSFSTSISSQQITKIPNSLKYGLFIAFIFVLAYLSIPFFHITGDKYAQIYQIAGYAVFGFLALFELRKTIYQFAILFYNSEHWTTEEKWKLINKIIPSLINLIGCLLIIISSAHSISSIDFTSSLLFCLSSCLSGWSALKENSDAPIGSTTKKTATLSLYKDAACLIGIISGLLLPKMLEFFDWKIFASILNDNITASVFLSCIMLFCTITVIITMIANLREDKKIQDIIFEEKKFTQLIPNEPTSTNNADLNNSHPTSAGFNNLTPFNQQKKVDKPTSIPNTFFNNPANSIKNNYENLIENQPDVSNFAIKNANSLEKKN